MNGFNTNGKDSLKLRLMFMKRHWIDRENMYKKMEDTNIGNRKDVWEEKKLMSWEIWNSLEKLIEDIENGVVEIK